MNKLIFLIGLPSSGKSTFAKKNFNSENDIILSSDELRIELFNDVNNQDNNGKLFEELFNRAAKYLKEDKNVIIDATNINMKKRIITLNDNRFKNYYKECYYFDSTFEFCLYHDKQRNRQVGHNIIEKMYKNMQIPIYQEGWNKINIIHQGAPACDVNLRFLKERIENIVLNKTIIYSHDDLFNYPLNQINCLKNIFNFPQDTKYHSFSVSRHTYHVWRWICNLSNLNQKQEEKLIMLWAALFHDVGKYFCKNFKDNSRYANFIWHENVSAQIACRILYYLGYNEEFILNVTSVIGLHMRLLQLQNAKEDKVNNFKQFVGEELYNKLDFFREADVNAR